MKKLYLLFLYLFPFFTVVGSNVNLFSIGGRFISIGYSEAFVLIGLFFSLIKSSKIKLPTKLSWAVFYFTLSILLSAITQLLFYSSLPSSNSIVETIRWVEYLLIFFIFYNSIQEEKQIRNILIVSSFASCIFIYTAISQAINFNFYDVRIYGTFESAADRVGDSISNPNVAGAFLMGIALFSFAFYNSVIKCFSKYFAFGLMFISISLMILTLSRSAILGFTAGLLVLWSLLRINRFKLIYILFLPVIILLNFYSQNEVLLERFFSSFDASTVSGGSVIGRFERTQIAITKGIDNFWFGVGFGDFERHFGFLTPDNMYAEIFSEVGIFGLLSFLFLLYIIHSDLIIIIRKNSKNSIFNTVRFGFYSTFIALLVACIAANLFRSPRILALFWMFLAIVYRYSSILSPTNINSTK